MLNKFICLIAYRVAWPNGKASDYESEDSGLIKDKRVRIPSSDLIIGGYTSLHRGESARQPNSNIPWISVDL
ncbi:Uncharacterized protein HZ326_9429 [Fusarium oxysporum f. sp. albedinis]|nr:Uncharacterized protein HZ326_9429 [Fusarium oxysporum f. sp. albedinis]